jgi:hypothetical protein
MNFLIDKFGTWDASNVEEYFKAYAEYLETVRSSLPDSAFSFAAAPWHYQFQDHHCPHDGWVEHMKVWELASGERKQHRQIQIDLRVLGAFHDGYLDLQYKNVSSYTLSGQPHGNHHGPTRLGHGDWLIDEVRLSENHLVLHEILFSDRGRWLIEASDILWEWKPLN